VTEGPPTEPKAVSPPNSRLTSSFFADSASKRELGEGEWRVREAEVEDVAGVAAGVAQLLVELSGGGPPPAELEAAARELIAVPALGTLLVAVAEGQVVGVLAASWQHAIHVPGRYGTIQDLWVDPDWRSRAIGHDLVEAYAQLARGQGAQRLEVGLPRESFPRIGATEAFYRTNGFEHLGPRMRRKL
jgi:para-aminobenzoate synthetase